MIDPEEPIADPPAPDVDDPPAPDPDEPEPEEPSSMSGQEFVNGLEPLSDEELREVGRRAFGNIYDKR